MFNQTCRVTPIRKRRGHTDYHAAVRVSTCPFGGQRGRTGVCACEITGLERFRRCANAAFWTSWRPFWRWRYCSRIGTDIWLSTLPISCDCAAKDARRRFSLYRSYHMEIKLFLTGLKKIPFRSAWWLPKQDSFRWHGAFIMTLKPNVVMRSIFLVKEQLFWK